MLLLLIRVGGGLGIGSIVLLLLGTQWYILFNVIAGAMAIPTDLKECCSVFRLRGIERWKKLILPGIFPYLVTGMVTASGGAWNASIVAEYFHFKGHIYTTTGLGATISQATDAGNFDLLLAATIMMAATVVTINRLLWRRLYASLRRDSASKLSCMAVQHPTFEAGYSLGYSLGFLSTAHFITLLTCASYWRNGPALFV